MRRVWMLVLPFAISAMVAIADCGVAHAVPVKPQPLSAVAPASDTSSWRTKPSVVHAEERPSVAHVAG